MNIIDDFEDIARRMNRKPEPISASVAGLSVEEQAAILSKSFYEASVMERFRNWTPEEGFAKQGGASD